LTIVCISINPIGDKSVHVRSDEELIQSLINGDQNAFDMLFKKYSRPLIFFIQQIIHDKSRTEDIFQDTFIKVLENADKFDSRYHFSTWIYRIAFNLSINELKKRKRERILLCNPDEKYTADGERELFEPHPEPITPFDYVLQNEQSAQINSALNRLTTAQRTAFMLKFNHHLTYDEIADVMECSSGTVKSRIHYAVEKIKEIIGA